MKESSDHPDVSSIVPVKTTSELELDQLLGWLREAIKDFPDKRVGRNRTYTMEDVGLGAFSVFFTQSPSFLAFQSAMKNERGEDNAQTLFGMEKIPTDNHIRDLLDPVAPAHLNSVFASALDALESGGYLDAYRSIEDTLLVALDGTQYHSSKAIHCENCSTKTHGDGSTSYSHIVVTPVIVSPGNPRVIPLEPQFVTPQDGHEKQDCENAAAKRWIEAFGERHRTLGTTLLGDDLYCHHPLCEQVLSEGLNFIFVCKPKSHKTLYEWVSELDALNAIQTVKVRRGRGKKEQIDTYRFAKQVPLRDSDDALMVNWCEITTTNRDGKVLYHNAFVTNHSINEQNVVAIVEAGRARWKIENENNNTLKTKGYNLTHNYGHGKKHLSSLLCTMTIMALLFHTLLSFGDERYRKVRQALPRRDTFFHDLRALTRYMCFKSWPALLSFMMRGLEIDDINTT